MADLIQRDEPILVTGAAGFIGRWVVGELLDRGQAVLPVDNLMTGAAANLEEFEGREGYTPLVVGDIRDAGACQAWVSQVDAVAHPENDLSLVPELRVLARVIDNVLRGRRREAAEDR